MAAVSTQECEGRPRSVGNAPHSCLHLGVCSCLSVHHSGVRKVPSSHMMASLGTAAGKNYFIHLLIHCISYGLCSRVLRRTVQILLLNLHQVLNELLQQLVQSCLP